MLAKSLSVVINNFIQSFEWPNVVSYNSSLVDIRVELSFWDCVCKFLQCLILYCVFLFYSSFNLSPSFNVFCNGSLIVDHSFYFIGSLPPSNSLFDIIDSPRWIVDGGSSFEDVSSALVVV